MCYAAAAILTPSGASSQLTPAVMTSAEPDVAQAPIKPVTPARDAFAPRVAAAMDAPPPVTHLLPSPPPMTARLLPAQPTRVERTARVTAIVTGPAPTAIVDIDGVPRTAGIGDRIAGARIIGIDATAIELDNGTRLQLAPDAP